jgi:hypothetical protein
MLNPDTVDFVRPVDFCVKGGTWLTAQTRKSCLWKTALVSRGTPTINRAIDIRARSPSSLSTARCGRTGPTVIKPTPDDFGKRMCLGLLALT